MKVLIYAFLLVSGCFISCGTTAPKQPSLQSFDPTKRGKNIPGSSTEIPQSSPLKQVTPENELSQLAIEMAGMKFMVTIDDVGNVTVLDYPSFWQGKMRLVRFDGQDVDDPFSSEQCKIVRGSASSGYGNISVRNWLSFRADF